MNESVARDTRQKSKRMDSISRGLSGEGFTATPDRFPESVEAGQDVFQNTIEF